MKKFARISPKQLHEVVLDFQLYVKEAGIREITKGIVREYLEESLELDGELYDSYTERDVDELYEMVAKE